MVDAMIEGRVVIPPALFLRAADFINEVRSPPSE
jgi:hypothetical protein